MSTNFRDSLKIVPSGQDEKKSNQIEAYRNFVGQAFPGYIRFMEAINLTIAQLEDKGIIGKTKLRTRLKTINSAIHNTDEKALDDIFGFELITQNERDKEILMIIMHNLFVKEYIRQKNHNKSNGYFAHHCTGTVKNKLGEIGNLNIQEQILNDQTNELKEEYRDIPRKEQKKYNRQEIFTKKLRYPTLRKEIIEKGQIDVKLQEGLTKALDFIEQYLGTEPEVRKNIPVFEVQFKTSSVEEKIKSGRAQHVKYKKVNEDEIKTQYKQRRLIRGINFPFVFIRDDNGNLQIEQSQKTLIDMWPFLEDTINACEQTQPYPIMNYDMYFAKVFPELEQYVRKNLINEPSLSVTNFSQENVWSIIKNKILRNDFVMPYYKQLEQVLIESK